MNSAERYVVEVDGSPTAMIGVSRLGALAFTTKLLDATEQHSLQTIAIHEQVTGEPRACWYRDRAGWRELSVPGWLS